MLLFDYSINREATHGVDSAPFPAEFYGSEVYGVGSRYSASGAFKYKTDMQSGKKFAYADLKAAASRVMHQLHEIGAREAGQLHVVAPL